MKSFFGKALERVAAALAHVAERLLDSSEKKPAATDGGDSAVAKPATDGGDSTGADGSAGK